jgi:nitroreductase
MDFMKQLYWRYATKQFDPSKKISEQDLALLLESLRLSPSSFGLDPWKFLVITDPKKRAELKGMAWGQSQITDASHLIVLCAQREMNAEQIQAFVQRTGQTQGLPVENLKSLNDMITGSVARRSPAEVAAWNQNHVYIALGFLLSTAAYLGIDACPMEGFDAAAFDKALGLEAQGLHATVLAAIGYRSADDKYASRKKVRKSKAEVVAMV